MAITDDLRAIAGRADAAPRDTHEFYTHSLFARASVETAVVEMDRPTLLRNAVTGTTIDGAGLITRTPRYILNSLASFTFRHCVSIFEVFLFDFGQRLLMHNPWQFADRQLGVRVVLEAGSREEILAEAIRKQLNELKYEPPREWFAALRRTVRLDCPSADEIDTLAEIKAARDILEHNAGVTNETYPRKAGRKARCGVGDPLQLDDAYHLASWTLLRKIVDDMASAAVARLSRP